MAEVAVGVLVYQQRDKVRGNTETGPNQLKCVHNSDQIVVFLCLMLKAGAAIADFYNSLYTLYVMNQDPGIAVTLTFIHNTVCT